MKLLSHRLPKWNKGRAALVSAGIYILLSTSLVAGPETTTNFYTEWQSPDGSALEYFVIQEPIADTSAPYGHLKALIYQNMVLRSPSGEKTQIFRMPSSPGDPNPPFLGQPIQALMDGIRIEVLEIRGGGFSLFRFEKKDAEWIYRGTQTFDDLNPTNIGSLGGKNGGESKWAETCQLVDWSTVRLTMLDESIRVLTVAPDGVILENGLPYKHEHSKPYQLVEFATHEEKARWQYLESMNSYYEPRDKNGVPMSVVAHFQKQASEKSKVQLGAKDQANTADETPISAKDANGAQSSATVVVPDTKKSFRILAPAAILLGGMGLFVFWIIRRRNRRA